MTKGEFVDNIKRQSDSALYKFLQQYRATDIDGNVIKKGAKIKPRPIRDDEAAITTRLPKGGSYYVPKKELSKMCKMIYKDIQNRSVFYATEKPNKEDSPFRVDIDLKTVIRAKSDGLDLKNIYIKIYDYFADFIQKNFQIDDKHLTCYVLTKRDIRTKRKDDEEQELQGIHLHFPYARGTYLQLKKIREIVTYISDQDNVFTGQLTAKKCIDPIETTNWTLYGSVKDNMAYRVSHVLFRKKGKSTKIRNFSVIGDSSETVKTFLMTNIEGIKLMKPTDNFKEKIEEEIQDREKRKDQWKKEIKNGEYNEIELEKANQLCHMLDPSRFDGRLGWRNLGLALYSVSGGHQEGFQLWELMSEKMDPEAFNSPDTAIQMRNIWQWASELDNCPYSMGSLKWWAKQDSPKEYEEWRRNTNRSLTELAIKVFNEGALADLASELYGKEFQYTTNDNWYRFLSNNGHWKRDPYSNAKWIQNVFRYELKTYIREYIRGEEHLSDCFKNIAKLGTKSLINNCVAMAKSNFSTDENFEDKLDQNPYLIGDMNGVYDLSSGIHRHGTPEDYISMKMGAYYRDYTWEHPDVRSVMRFWAKIHVDPVIRRFFLKAISVCMVAGNKEKMILVMTNDNGDAGKSACLKIIEKVWGDYSITLQRERFVVQSQKSAGAAAPDIANARNKRMGSVKELSKDETLDIGSLKLFSGSDDVQVRTLYKEGGNMQILLTMILMMNKLPPIPPGDKPTWNRLRVIPFESIFNDDAPSDPREQWLRKHFKPDKDIKTKLDKLKDAFYWVFLQYFKIYQTEEGLYPLPEKVKVATQNYRDSNNIFEQFLKSAVVETLNKKDTVKITEDFYNEYMDWFRINSTGKKLIPPKYIDFKKNVIDHYKNKKTKIGETQKRATFFKYVQAASSSIQTIHGIRPKEMGDDEDKEKEENDEYEDIEDEDFYGEDIELSKEKRDEGDYAKYFEGPTFIGMDDSEISNVLVSTTM
jgi:phage/plasmid-associated DNA primase